MEDKKVRPWDLFNSKMPRASEELYDERLEICMSCEHLVSLTKQCSLCKCFMVQKTKLANASCPVGKWYGVKIGE